MMQEPAPLYYQLQAGTSEQYSADADDAGKLHHPSCGVDSWALWALAMAVLKMLNVCCVLCAESSVGDSHTRLGWTGLALCPSQLCADSVPHQADCRQAEMQQDADEIGAKQAGGDHSSTAMTMTDCGDDFELFAEDADQLLHDANAFDAYPGVLYTTHCAGAHWCVGLGGG
jgi:hypothetical protein